MVHLDGFIAFITADTLKVIWSGLKVTLLITAAYLKGKGYREVHDIGGIGSYKGKIVV